jgi:4-hydroxy-tetrahydrodipicolinate synthase
MWDKKMIRGSIVALVTPMDASGVVDEKQLADLIEFHIKEGTDAIVSVGTTGESATLNESEHCAVIRKTVEVVAGRIPVIAGTGANSTTEAITLTQCAKEVGADAALLVTPYYNKPTQEGLYLHYRAISEAVDIPQILYNVPGRTACDMLPETVARLSSIKNIIGIKEASDLSVQRQHELRELCGKNFLLYSGNDDTGCQFCLEGGDGVISVTANVAPALMHELYQAALAGDQKRAEIIDLKLAALHCDLFLEANPIPVKWAVAEMGLMSKGIRLPLTWLSEEHHGSVRAAMRQANIQI